MASTYSLIIEDVKNAIAAITPEDLPDVPFTLSTSPRPLGDAALLANEMARTFCVYGVPNPESTDTVNLSQAEFRQSVLAEIRYRVTDKFGGELFARTLGAADAARILHQVCFEWLYPLSGARMASRISNLPARNVRSLGNDIYVTTMEFRFDFVMNTVGDDPEPSP